MNSGWPVREQVIVLVPPACPMFLKAIANTDALGMIDLTVDPLESVMDAGVSPLAVRIDRFAALPECVAVVVLAANIDDIIAAHYRDSGLYVIAEVTRPDDVAAAHAIMVRGSCGKQTLALLAAIRNCDKPLFARDGLDRQTLAAASKSGASGFVFAENFWLLPECDLSASERRQLTRSVPGTEISLNHRAFVPGVDVKLATFVAMRSGSLKNAINLALLDAKSNLTDRLLGPSLDFRIEKNLPDQEHIQDARSKKRGLGWETSPRPNSIAIIGVGAILPKSGDVSEFWDNVKSRVDTVTEVPKGRWRPGPEVFFDPDPLAPDKTYSKIGCFVDPVDFDCRLFGIPPKVAQHIDEPQKWMLLATTQALTNAGYCKVQGTDLVLRDFDHERTAVIFGNSMGGDLKANVIGRVMFPVIASAIRATPTIQSLDDEIVNRMLDEIGDQVRNEQTAINQHTLPGGLPNIIAGRVAATFDLHGTNCVVDAACSSSFAALDFAMKGLRNGEHDMVICGGADQTMDAFSYVSFAKVGALSPSGCKPYDRDADGLTMGEGAGVFILRRLEDAIHDNDQILAVIRGIGSSSDGTGEGITAPNGDSQEIALRRAYADAEISPAFIDLVEGHGTGTKRGDLTEINALNRVFGGYDLPPRSVPIGSVKSQIGHLKAGAGAAGLIKTALALHDRVIPPSIHFDNPNPEIDWDNTPFYVATEMTDWPERSDGEPRRAAVSAFGFGGTNYHVVLEEYLEKFHHRLINPVNRKQHPGSYESYVLAFFSGNNPEDVASALRRFAEKVLASGENIATLADESRSLARVDPGVRCALLLSSVVDEALQTLKTARAKVMESQAPGVYADGNIFLGVGPANTGKIAFLFPGQGSQFINMGRQLAASFTDVNEILAIAERHLWPELGLDISRAIGPGTWNATDQSAIEAALQRTEVLQPALVAVEVAVCRLLMKWGIQPHSCAGHSIGEFSALVAASGLSYEDALTACLERGRNMANIPENERGCMASIRGSPGDFVEICQADDSLADVFIANLNGPRETIIAGATPAVEEAIQRLKKAGIAARKIRASHAFHTGFVSTAQQPLSELLNHTSFKAPRIPVISNVSADVYPAQPDQIRQLLVEQVVSPVRWQESLERLYKDGHRIFIEAGPGNTLSSLVNQTLPGDDVAAFSALANEETETRNVIEVIARLFCLGKPVSLVPRVSMSSNDPQGAWHELSDRGDPTIMGDTNDLSPYQQIPASIREEPLWSEVWVDVQDILLTITGYEPEELGLDKRLGTGLHLDSLDTLESFMEFERRFDLPELDREYLIELPQVTIGRLVDWITAYKTGMVAAKPAKLTVPERPCRRLGVRWKQLPRQQCVVSLQQPVHITGRGESHGKLTAICEAQNIKTTDDVALARSILCSPRVDSKADFETFLETIRYAHPDLRKSGTIGVLVPPDPWGGAYCGFLKSLQNEMPSTRCTAIRNASAEDLLAEVQRENRPVEVLKLADELRQAAYENVPANVSSERLRGGNVVLMIGGARGIGAACAVALASSIPDLIFILSGRSNGQDRVVQETLDSIRMAGATVFYEQVDITLQAGCEQLISVAENKGPLGLVVYVAGLQNSQPFMEKSREIVRQTLATKTDAARHMVELATRGKSKPEFLFFGSTAARFGNVNQTDYAAANDYLAHFSAELRKQGIQARTLAWAPWAETGMAVTSKSLNFLNHLGVEPLSNEEGVKAFIDEVLCQDDESEVVLAKGLGPVEPFPDHLETWRVSAEEWFLADHRIGRNSEAVLPGVMTLDRFCRTGRDLFSSSVAEAADVQWLVATAVGDDKPLELTVRIRPEESDCPATVKMWLETQTGIAIAQAELRSHASEQPPTCSFSHHSPMHDIWRIDGPSLYRQLFTHGKSFQALKRVGQSRSGLLVGELIPQEERNSGSAIDPVALEGAFQLASIYHVLETGRQCVPVTTDLISWFNTNTSACYAAVHSPDPTTAADGLVFDLELIDKAGNVVACCKRYRVKSVGDSIPSGDMQVLQELKPAQCLSGLDMPAK